MQNQENFWLTVFVFGKKFIKLGLKLECLIVKFEKRKKLRSLVFLVDFAFFDF